MIPCLARFFHLLYLLLHLPPTDGVQTEFSLDPVNRLIELFLLQKLGKGKQTLLLNVSGELGNAETDKSDPGFKFGFHKQFIGQMIDLLGAGGGSSQSMTASNLFKISEFDF